jgi:micrococcal nuclease
LISGLFIILLLIAVIGFIASLIKPKLNFWTKSSKRKHSFIYLAAALIFFILFGVTAPPTPSGQKSVNNETKGEAVVAKKTTSSSDTKPISKEKKSTTAKKTAVAVVATNSKDVKKSSSDKQSSSTSQTAKSTTTSSEQKKSSAIPSYLVPAVVSKNTDGDTIHVTLNGKDETIRMLLIDTPEEVDPKAPVEPFAYTAANYTRQVLPVGKHIYLEEGKPGYTRDKYGRLLVFVYITPKDMYNEDVVKKGYARVAYIYPPNTQHLSTLQSDQSYAKAHKLGIWSISGYVTSSGYSKSISCSYAAKNGYSTRTCGTTTTKKSTSTTTTKNASTTTSKTTASSSGKCDIKGNISSSGEKIYHLPGDRWYNRTIPEKMFCTVQQAVNAGFRAPKG